MFGGSDAQHNEGSDREEDVCEMKWGGFDISVKQEKFEDHGPPPGLGLGGLKRSRPATVDMLQPKRTLVSRGSRLVIVDTLPKHEKLEDLQKEEDLQHQHQQQQQQQERKRYVSVTLYNWSSRSRLSSRHVQLLEDQQQDEQQGEQQLAEQQQAEQSSEQEDSQKQQQQMPQCVTVDMSKRSSRSRLSTRHAIGGMFQPLKAIREEEEEEWGEEEEGEEDDYGEDEEEEGKEETGDMLQLQEDQQQAEQQGEQHLAEQQQAEQQQAEQEQAEQQQDEQEQAEQQQAEQEQAEQESEQEAEQQEEEEEEEEEGEKDEYGLMKEKHSDSELQPGDHAVETEELEEEEMKLHYYYDLEPISRSFIGIDRGTYSDAMYLYAQSKGYSPWQCYQYAQVHAEGIFTYEESPHDTFPSKYLMALRREVFVKERRHEQLKWVYKRLKEQGHSLATKAKKRVGRSAISLMVADIFVSVMEGIERTRVYL